VEKEEEEIRVFDPSKTKEGDIASKKDNPVCREGEGKGRKRWGAVRIRHNSEKRGKERAYWR